MTKIRNPYPKKGSMSPTTGPTGVRPLPKRGPDAPTTGPPAGGKPNKRIVYDLDRIPSKRPRR